MVTSLECMSARELISAAVDDELPAAELRLLDDHLEGCPLCRGYAERVSALTRTVRLRGVEPLPDLTARVLDRARPPRLGRGGWLRPALAWVAVVIAAQSVQPLVFGDAAGATTHIARHLGAFGLALSLGMAYAAWRPHRAFGMLPFAVALVATTLAERRVRHDRPGEHAARRGGAPQRVGRVGAAVDDRRLTRLGTVDDPPRATAAPLTDADHHSNRASSSCRLVAGVVTGLGRRSRPRSTARPHPSTSPSRRSWAARPRSPAGHGSDASAAGPSRIARADNPVPAAACQAAAVATGDVSTAASSHTLVSDVGTSELTGTPGNQAPHGSATASTMRVWLATSTLGTSLRRAQARIARVEPSEVDAGRRELPLGEADRAFAPVAPSWVDQPARHQRRPGAVVGDGGDQPVVLVAEVEAAAGPVADRPVGRQCRELRDSELVGDDVGPRCIRPRLSPRSHVAGTTLSIRNPRAHTSTWASNIWCGDHHDQFIDAEAVASARTGPASRDARIDCGSTRPTRPSPGSASRIARARNSAAASAYGPPPCRLAPPRVVEADICERNGGLPRTTSNRRRPQSNARASARINSAPGTSADAIARGSSRHPSASPADRGRRGGGRRPPETVRRRTPGRAPARAGRSRRRRRLRTCRRSCARRPCRRGRRACTRRPTACACAWSIPSSAHRERRVRCRAGPVPPFRP